MVNNPQSIEIFVTSVFKRKLCLDANFFKKSILKHIKKKRNKGMSVSNIGGEQYSIKNLFLEELENSILENASLYLEHLGYIKKELNIPTIWANINGYKDFNLQHNHGTSILSGVYYLDVPENSGNLIFVNPAIDMLGLQDDFLANKHTTFTSSKCTMEPNEDDLFLFPSWLSHYVLPNLNKTKKRVSLAFNIDYIKNGEVND